LIFTPFAILIIRYLPVCLIVGYYSPKERVLKIEIAFKVFSIVRRTPLKDRI
jgi:hypothetical protein